jgi:hypothetical protein
MFWFIETTVKSIAKIFSKRKSQCKESTAKASEIFVIVETSIKLSLPQNKKA